MIAAILVAGLAAFASGDDDRSRFDGFQRVYLVFAEEHISSFVSGFGHVFVVLAPGPVDFAEQLLAAPAVNFGADIGPEGRGRWIGFYSIQPMHELVRKNSHFDQRRLTLYELDLVEEELRSLERSLEERLGRPYPYDFFRRNCGHYLVDWLDREARTSASSLYLTPRQAVDRILSVYPPRSTTVIPSQLEVLEDALAEKEGISTSFVRSALTRLDQIEAIEDLEVRLLTIQLASSMASRSDFERLDLLQRESLRSPRGAEAARAVVARRAKLRDLEPMRRPTLEGARGAIRLVGDGDAEGWRVRAEFEPALRRYDTLPVHSHMLQEVRFLSTRLDLDGDGARIDVDGLVLSNILDARGLMGGWSKGATISYLELENALGLDGIATTFWLGLSSRLRHHWFGARLTLLADGLEANADACIAPGVTWDATGDVWSAHAEVHLTDREHPGWSTRVSRRLAPHAQVQLSVVDDPTDDPILVLGFSLDL